MTTGAANTVGEGLAKEYVRRANRFAGIIRDIVSKIPESKGIQGVYLLTDMQILLNQCEEIVSATTLFGSYSDVPNESGKSELDTNHRQVYDQLAVILGGIRGAEEKLGLEPHPAYADDMEPI